MILIGAIKPIVENKFKTCFIFTRLFRGGELRAYEMKPVLFLYAVGFLAATTNITHKKGDNKISIIIGIIDMISFYSIKMYQKIY